MRGQEIADGRQHSLTTRLTVIAARHSIAGRASTRIIHNQQPRDQRMSASNKRDRDQAEEREEHTGGDDGAQLKCPRPVSLSYESPQFGASTRGQQRPPRDGCGRQAQSQQLEEEANR